MNVERLPGGPWGQNAFLVVNGSQSLLIDPGGSADELLQALSLRQISLVGIINTHGHFDHIGGVQPLMDATGAGFYISGRELPIMRGSNLLRFIFKSKEKVVVPTVFTDLDLLNNDLHLVGLAIHCYETPGHTPGGYCFRIDDHLFSGDTLLRKVPGSTDLPGGDAAALARSIDMLRTLPQTLILHPGHGYDTTLGEALSQLPPPNVPDGE